VLGWIEKGWLQAESQVRKDGRVVRRFQHDAVKRFCSQYRAVLLQRRWPKERLSFCENFVFAPKHAELIEGRNRRESARHCENRKSGKNSKGRSGKRPHRTLYQRLVAMWSESAAGTAPGNMMIAHDSGQCTTSADLFNDLGQPSGAGLRVFDTPHPVHRHRSRDHKEHVCASDLRRARSTLSLGYGGSDTPRPTTESSSFRVCHLLGTNRRIWPANHGSVSNQRIRFTATIPHSLRNSLNATAAVPF
jgi:hypothetical protein